MRLIFVAGMHRSGTSLVTELIHTMGAAVGGELLEPAADNPHGFFERHDVKRVNDMVLSRLGGSWDRPPTGLSDAWPNSGGLDRLRSSAEAAITGLFDEAAGADVCVVKDPRFSLTAPFWNSVVKIDGTVVPVRDPREVAQSLRHRNGMAPARTAALWLRYTIDAVLGLPAPHVVALHELASDPDRVVGQLARFVGLEAGADDALAVASERTRNWVPPDVFVSVSDDPVIRLATSVFWMLTSSEHLDAITPVLQRLSDGWQPMGDVQGSGTGNAKATEAAAARATELHRELEDSKVTALDFKEERDLARRDLRTATRQGEEVTKQLRSVEEVLADHRRQLGDERTRRTTAEQQLHDEQTRRTTAEQQLHDERTRRTTAEQQRRSAARRARSAERNFERLKSRRSVRLALAASRPFRPVIQTVRRARTSRLARPRGGRESPSTADKPPGGSTGIRKSYESFPAGQDEHTRDALRAHRAAQPHLRDTKVSIVMPTFNRADQIGTAIDSVVAQTHQSWELLVIDDGSDDDTESVVAHHLASDPRIRYERNERGGVSRARNTGLDLATGSLIAFLDTDNSWDPEFLALMVAEIDRSGSDIAYSAMRSQKDEEVVGYRGDRFDYRELLAGNYVDINVICHTRSIVDGGARFDTTLRRMVDWDYLLSITRGRTVSYAPFIGGTYKYHESEDQISNREPYLYRKLVAARHSLERAAGADSVPDTRALLREHVLDIAICLAAPREGRDVWGDYHFGLGLAQALERRGHRTRLYYFEEQVADRPDVTISLRGLTGHQKPAGSLLVVWSISHPDLLSWSEIEDCDLFFSASLTWPRMLDWAAAGTHHVLPQATDRARFFPRSDVTDRGDEVLFVGNSRNADRPMVTRSAAAGLPVSVYGTRWEDRLPGEFIKGSYLPNEDLSRHYASAGLVLNDHWDSMRDFGYVSNRTFDVLGSGGSLLSDHLPSLSRLFGDWVATVGPNDDIGEAATRLLDARPTADRAASTWVLEHHSFDCRAESLLAHIEAHLLGDDVYSGGARGNHDACGCRITAEASSQGPAERSLGPIIARGTSEQLRVAIAPQATRRGFTSSAYIRLVQPLTSEIDDSDIDLFRVRPDGTHDTAKQALAGADALVVSRTAFSDVADAEHWLDAADALSVPVVLDVDDAFHLMDETHPEFTTYRERIDALRLVMARSADIWCSTVPLAESITGLDIQPAVVPNSIDPRLWRRYRPIEDPPSRGGDHGLEVLYAGTATHGRDFVSILPALDRLAERARFRLTVIGVAPDLVEREWLRRLVPQNSGQYPRYATWIRDLAPLFDVGIAPLVDNPFNRLKSDIKILEYLALGLVPIASAVGPYQQTDAVISGGLCADTGDWVNRLDNLAANPEALDETRQQAWLGREKLWEDRNAGLTGAALSTRLLALADR